MRALHGIRKLIPDSVHSRFLVNTPGLFLSKKRDLRHVLESSQLSVAGPKLAVGVMCGHVLVDLSQFQIYLQL